VAETADSERIIWERGARVTVATLHTGPQSGSVHGPDPAAPYVRLDNGTACSYDLDRLTAE
jgi:hypothetical protein